MNTHWIRSATGVCAAAALIAGAGIAFAPAASAAPTSSDPTVAPSGLLGVVGSTLTSTTGAVGGIVGGVLTPTPTSTAPISVTSGGSGSLDVAVGGTTVGVGVGGGSVGVGVTGPGGSGVGVVLGGSSSGGTVTGTVTPPSTPQGGTPTSGTPSTGTPSTGTPTTGAPTTGSPSTGTPSGGSVAPIVLTALHVTPSVTTVYPAKDGYVDTVTFRLSGTTSDGQQHAANGTATLTFGSSTVASWPIRATNDAIVWNGLKGGKVVPGRYRFTAQIGDTTAVVSGSESVVVSAKKLATTSHVLRSKAVSGTHKMAAKPLSGLSKGKVTLKITSKAKGIKGKQYLVFSHGSKKIKVLIRNGKHTSKAITIPKSFTTYTISHTWKKGVKIGLLQYRYSYKTLK